MKRQILIIFLTFGLLIQCKKKEVEVQKTKKIQLIFAENIYDLSGKINLKIFSDSSYTFESSPSYEKAEKFNGFCFQKNDTIYFKSSKFKYCDSQKAVIKNNFIEFVDGKFPLKIEIKKSTLKSRNDLDFEKYNDYAIFTYNQKFHRPTYYGYEPNTLKPFDLKQNELIKIDEILKKCFNENPQLREYNDYVKQCIPVLNSKNEKVIWISLYCKDPGIELDYKYSIINMSDGGNCNVNLKINLTKGNYSELNIAGEA